MQTQAPSPAPGKDALRGQCFRRASFQPLPQPVRLKLSVFPGSSPEQLLQPVLSELCADYAEFPGDIRLSRPDAMLPGHIVEVDPGAVLGGDHALGTQDGAVFAAVQGGQYALDAGCGELCGRLLAPTGEHFIGMVVAVVVMMIMAAAAVSIVVMVMLVALSIVMVSVLTAFLTIMVMMLMAAVLALLMVMMPMTTALALFMMVLMTTAFLTIMFMVMPVLAALAPVMVMPMAAALALLMVMVPMTTALFPVMVMVMFVLAAFPFFMVMVLMAATLLIIMVMMVPMTAALLPVMVMVMFVPTALALFMMVMLMLLLGMLQHLLHHIRQGIRPLYGLQHGPALQLRQRRGDDRSLVIVLPNQPHALLHLGGIRLVRPAQDNRPRVLDLIDEEFTEVLDIHLRLGGVHHRHGAVHLHVQIRRHVLHGPEHIRKLPHPGGLDQDALRRVGLDDFL